jgi:hypothetical protein
VNISAGGIAVELPPGFEGAITGTGKDDADATPVVHLSTSALGPGRGDFGSGAVEHLGPDDVFLALVEYGPDCVGSELFAAQGFPRRLRPRSFQRRALQRTIDGQCGQQLFFTEAGRAFCLYVVLGRDHDLDPLVERVHTALDAIQIRS